MTTDLKPIAIYYEHPDWFRPLFAELKRRGTSYLAIDAGRHQYDPAETEPEHALLFNRMSPSAYLRGNGQSIFYTLNYLETSGTPRGSSNPTVVMLSVSRFQSSPTVSAQFFGTVLSPRASDQ